MDNLASLPLVGPKTVEKLNHLKIKEPLDLLYHFPRRYLDFSHTVNLRDVVPNTHATVRGKLISFKNIFTRSRKNLQKAVIRDHTGSLELMWFNQPYLVKNFIIGHLYNFAGEVTLYQNRPTIISPYSGIQTGKILPVYPETKGLNSGWFRRFFSANLDSLLLQTKDPLPPSLLEHYHLFDLIQSLKQIHQPDNLRLLAGAQTRLSLSDTLSLLAQSRLLLENHQKQKVNLEFKNTLQISKKIEKFIKTLPFKLTPDQINVWQEIKNDLTSSVPANRLLQGDVGSGKTILAILACLFAYYHHSSSLIVAPTEVLAQQHFKTFSRFLPELNLKLITGISQKQKINKTSIIISTHAAFYRKKSLPSDIGVLLIDEQHKFGVRQRNFLSALPNPPHCFTMTATPIPRTVSLALLGHLSISTLTKSPHGRLPVKTFLVPPHKISACYDWLNHHITSTGQQAFIVCPLIDPSETLESVKSAKTEYEILQTSIFPKLKLGLIHGNLKQSDRQKILSDFNRNKINILVTTPIIEVGMDIPNSTCIIIQSADRFGLAQLHQLRGRVGRGADQSYCYLFTESSNPKALNRLDFITRHHHGQEIADYDLKTRRPGEIFSTLHHGFISTNPNSLSNYDLIKLSQEIIIKLISKYPDFDLHHLLTPVSSVYNYTISN